MKTDNTTTPKMIDYNKNIKANVIHTDLLHIVDEDSNGKFVYIKNFEKLMGPVVRIKVIIVSMVCQSLHHMKGFVIMATWVIMMQQGQ